MLILWINYIVSLIKLCPIKVRTIVNCPVLSSKLFFIVVQSPNRVQLFVTPCTAARQDSLSITNSWTLLKLISIKWVMPSNNLILCCSLLLLPSIFPSIKVFSNGLALCIRCPRYWTLNFSIRPLDKYSVWSPCYPRVSQESSPRQQFKVINSAFRLFYCPTLTSVHDY